MPNYYITVEKVGKGCWEENGELKHFDLPNSCGFKSEKDAGKLRRGDRLIDYVAPRWGFAIVMEVREWEKGQTYRVLSDERWDYLFRVKVEVLCEIKCKNLMPKWADLRPNLDFCQGKSPKGAAQVLRGHPLVAIDEHDFELIAAAIRRGKPINDSGKKPKRRSSTTEFVEEVRELLQRYDQET